jgi:Uma2 family endonuclease
MSILLTDPFLQERLKAERNRCGADRYDEVWEGVYMMTPLPDSEHQQMVARFTAAFEEVIDYRIPDVAVLLKAGGAQNFGTHCRGAADFLVEISSPDDRVREKLPFYNRLGVRELLLVDRSSWTLELYCWQEGERRLVGQSRASAGDVLRSEVVPLQFQLVPAGPRPRIEVTATETGRRWSV